MGYTYRIIQDEAKFEKFACRYHIFLVATLCTLFGFVYLKREHEILNNVKISDLSFRYMMQVLATAMASRYIMSHVVRIYYYRVLRSTGLPLRMLEEMSMFDGFLTLVFFVMNLYGFFLGFFCVSVMIGVLDLAIKSVKTHQA